MYTALVRPIVACVSFVWSPYTAKHRRLIEYIQRRATKFILNHSDRKTSYTARLKNLSPLPLEFRREIHDIVILYKIRSGPINANFDHLLPPANHT